MIVNPNGQKITALMAAKQMFFIYGDQCVISEAELVVITDKLTEKEHQKIHKYYMKTRERVKKFLGVASLLYLQ